MSSFAKHAAQQTDKRISGKWKGIRSISLHKHGEAIAAALSGLFIVIAWVLGHVVQAQAPSIVMYVLAYVIGGYTQAREGVRTLLREKDLDVNLLMMFAAVGAACIGYWEEGALLIFIFSTSGALETYVTQKSTRDISKLMGLKPETAVLYKNGKESVVPVRQLAIGDIIIVKPGEYIPADGTITSGSSAINQASITGESIPVDKQAGDEVFTGTLNGQGALFVEVTRESESTLFARIIKLVQEAQQEMPKSQLFVKKFERIYARVIFASTFVLLFAPHYLFQWEWDVTLYRAMVFLVVASPCALVASIMPAMLSAISSSARKGVLFKGGAHLENLSRVKVVAFDKTGTLTEGKPSVMDIIPLQGQTEEQLLQAVASLESLSEHPIARAIVQRAEQSGLQFTHPGALEMVTGFGIQGVLAGEQWKVGKPGFIDEAFMTDDIARMSRELQSSGKTVIIAQNTKGVTGIMTLQDRIREQARQVIQDLHARGIQTVMLTGDQRTTAETIAKEAGIDLVFAELLPENKVEMIKQLRARYGHIAMVGDGVNDAPALATASVGIAMGGAGSDAALETADVVLMKDDLTRLSGAMKLGRRMRAIIMQNIVFAITVIAALIMSNFAGEMTLPLGVIGHEGSTILVILNGLRLLRQQEADPR